MGIIRKLNMFSEVEEEAKFYSKEYFKKATLLMKTNTENIKLRTSIKELQEENELLKKKVDRLTNKVKKLGGNKNEKSKNTKRKSVRLPKNI